MIRCLNFAYDLWNRGCDNAGFYKNLATCQYRYDFTMELVLKTIEEPCYIIDCGTGTGTIPLLIALNFNNVKVKGIDITEIWTGKRILKFYPELEGRVLFQTLDVKEFTEKCDYTISTEVIEHIDDDKLAFKRIYESAEKGVIISVPNELSSPNIKGHLHRYTKDMLTALVAPYSAKEVKIIQPEGVLRQFYFMVIKKGD